MNKKNILSYYEDFKLHKGSPISQEGYFDYVSPSSLHSDITSFAYGIRKSRSCVNLLDDKAIFNVNISKKDLKRRFYVKLTATLLDYQKYVCGIKIKINGEEVYSCGNEFFENVNLGWPTLYLPVSNNLLNKGNNVLEIEQTTFETALLVSNASLLSLPLAKIGQQLTLRRYCREGEKIALSFYTEGKEVSVLEASDCVVEKIVLSPINKEHTVVVITSLSQKSSLTLLIDGVKINVLLPQVVDSSNDVCYVGTDSDDHRHDDNDETNRIFEIFTNTGLGDFVQIRPNLYRNYFDLSSKDTWVNRVEYLKLFNTHFSLSDNANVMPYIPELCEENFIGKHFHEAYLYFCKALQRDPQIARELCIDLEGLENSMSFGETKNLFCDALKQMYNENKSNLGKTSVGSPSLLTSYESRAGFERVTIEPVSNILLLIGAVRGAEAEMWGAHVPTDWYFGEPNDHVKARKFLLAMYLLYLNGADYVYAENSLFKTNAFSREDWEDDFCVTCRKYLRDFYDYTITHPREGELMADMAVVYGNNEYFMWHYDDRIAELGENGDWDIQVWGKWKNNSHHKLWRAIDSWLPIAVNQHTKNNCLNLDIFSGSPYGSVDVIPCDIDYSKYKVISLLGWNTYESGFAEKIRSYVENGGTAFLSFCHFNMVDNPDDKMKYSDEISVLLGTDEFEIINSDSVLYLNNNYEISKNSSIARFANISGEIVSKDLNGNPIVIKKTIGKGTLYFSTFADYDCSDGKLALLKALMKDIAEEKAEYVCSNPAISYTKRKLSNGKTSFDLINVCTNGKKPEQFSLKRNGQTVFSASLLPCEIKHVII